MPACTFFGHRDLNVDIRPLLLKELSFLIESCGVTDFYVGNSGKFDFVVQGVLRELSAKTPSLQYNIVLGYLPRKDDCRDFSNTIYPEGIESVPRRFALLFRNKWMVLHSDFAVCYITHSFGGAFQAVEYAKKQGLEIINLAEKLND